jgi:hypothetical protein
MRYAGPTFTDRCRRDWSTLSNRASGILALLEQRVKTKSELAAYTETALCVAPIESYLIPTPWQAAAQIFSICKFT